MLESTLLQLLATTDSRWHAKRERLLTAFLVLLYTGARLWRLTQFNLQRDEIFSLETARLGWRAIFATIAADIVHPPLFYLLLKIWIQAGGESLRWLRLLPTLIAFATLVPFLLLCRELRLPAYTRHLALFLLAVNAYLITYAHELRMYSLLVCFGLLTLWLFVRWWNSPRTSRLDWLTLFTAHLLLVYTHYYGWLIVGVEVLSMFLRRHGRVWFTALISLLLLCYGPWVAAIMTALEARSVDLGTQLGWHYKPGIVDVAAYYAQLNGSFTFARSTTIGILIFGGVILWAAYDIWIRSKLSEPNKRLVFNFLMALSLLPVVSAFIASRILPQSIWHARYLIISAVPYLLLIALAVTQLRPRWLRILLTVVVVVWSGLSGFNEVQRSDTRIAWDVLAREMRANEPAPGPIKVYALDDFPRYPMTFYLEGAGDNRFRIVRVTLADISQLKDDRLWIIYPEATWPFPSSASHFVQAQGYRIGPTFTSGPRGHRYILFAASK
jgi:mannosyltransferase